MSPEDVPAELVEKVARAIRADYVARYPEEPPVYHAGPGQPVWRHMARAALAAVLPEAMAEAWDEGAASRGMHGDAGEPNPHRAQGSMDRTFTVRRVDIG